MADTDRRTVGVKQRNAWRRSFAAGLFLSDVGVIMISVFGSGLLWFGFRPVGLIADGEVQPELSYTMVSVILVVTWMLMLDAFATRDHKVIGSGTLEYKRVADATVRLFGVFAIVAFLLRLELARGYFLTALPFGLILLLASRWAWRQWLRKRQARGRFVSRAILLGEAQKSIHVATTIQRTPGTGLHLVGAVTRLGSSELSKIKGMPVLGDYADLLSVVDDSQADTVIITGADDISPADMRRVGWELEARGVELIVAPALTDVAGPRIHSRPVAGLPLIHVSYPAFEGIKRVSKRAFDIVGSGLLIGLGSPNAAEAVHEPRS